MLFNPQDFWGFVYSKNKITWIPGQMKYDNTTLTSPGASVDSFVFSPSDLDNGSFGPTCINDKLVLKDIIEHEIILAT